MPTSRYDNLDPARRDELHELAAVEFATHGYSAASLNRIVAAWGMTKGSFYYYFADKEDLYATVLRRAIVELGREIDFPEGGRLQGPFWTETRRIFQDVLALVFRRPELVMLFRGLIELGGRAREAGPIGELLREARARTEAMLAVGQQQGVVRDDLPLALLADLTVAADEALDRWLVGQFDDGGATAAPEADAAQALATAAPIVEIYMDIMRRLLAPAGESPAGGTP